MIDKLKNSISGVKNEYNTVKRACGTIHEIEPKYLTISIVKSCIEMFLPYIAVYMLALVINELTGEKRLNSLVIYVGCSIALTALFSIILGVLNKKITILDKVFVLKIKKYMNNKIYGMDYEMIENSEFTEMHSKIVQIMFMTNGGIVAVVRLVSEYIGNILSFVIALFIILHSSLSNFNSNGVLEIVSFIVLCILIVFNIKITIVNLKKVNLKEYNLVQNTSTNNYIDYYHYNYMEDDKAAKDIHIFNQRDLILNEILEKGRLPWLKVLEGRYSLYQKYYGFNNAMSIFISGFAYIYIGIKALAKDISLGNVTKTYSAIMMLLAAFNKLFQTYTRIRYNNRFLKQFYEFIDTPEKQNEGSKLSENDDSKFEIEFKNVSFKYANTTEYALKNISLKINTNNRIAVVGENGSGKTTMIKLLCGLYQPTEGTITLNGQNIQNINHTEYLKLFSMVFQDFKLFSFPIGENVASNEEYNEAKVWNALKNADISEVIKKYPNKLSQFIYKYVNEMGIDLSGGEEQKIAIARAYYRDTAFVILDEPTASLDPLSEQEIYESLDKLADKKAAVFISHRLSSCRFCDYIYVFHKGEILQRGVHDALVKKANEKYYELWNAQARYYV